MSDEHEPAGQDWAGMATDSDAGAPGDHLPEPPLTADERNTLRDLQRETSDDTVEPVDDSSAMLNAVENDSPLPGAGGDADDPDSVRFEAPSA